MANSDFAIRAIGTYVPEAYVENSSRIGKFDYSQDALKNKIGVMRTARKASDETTSDMCVKAYNDLAEQLGDTLQPESLDLVVLVTQHPDNFGLPHTSAIVHGKLGLPSRCFAFDISLGCSGYVSALATVKGHLMATGGKRALLFTADPYSVSLSEDDKNTSMIFGDAATVTLIEPGENWQIGAFDSGTDGSSHKALERDEEGVLRMNGRAVFGFCALNVPKSVKATLEKNGLHKDQVDAFVLHPGSKYIVDTLSARLKIPAPETLPCRDYGNTISSSIPMMLAELDSSIKRTVFVSGFGVGLGWSSCVLAPGGN